MTTARRGASAIPTLGSLACRERALKLNGVVHTGHLWRPALKTSTVTTVPGAPGRDETSTSVLAGLFLMLAGVSLVIGIVGIANISLVGVMERTAEIGLRRALGAQPWHIAAQIVLEAAILGALGAGVGAALGLLTVISIAFAQQWTAVLDPRVVALSPLLGVLVGGVAGIYPALRASGIQPAETVRR